MELGLGGHPQSEERASAKALGCDREGLFEELEDQGGWGAVIGGGWCMELDVVGEWEGPCRLCQGVWSYP